MIQNAEPKLFSMLSGKEQVLVIGTFLISLPISAYVSYCGIFYAIPWLLLNVLGWTDGYTAIAVMLNPNNPLAITCFYVMQFLGTLWAIFILFIDEPGTEVIGGGCS